MYLWGFSRVFDGFHQILIKVEPFDQNERDLDKISQLEPLSFNVFCNDGLCLSGFPLLEHKGMHSLPSDLGGMIYSPQ